MTIIIYIYIVVIYLFICCDYKRKGLCIKRYTQKYKILIMENDTKRLLSRLLVNNIIVTQKNK